MRPTDRMAVILLFAGIALLVISVTVLPVEAGKVTAPIAMVLNLMGILFYFVYGDEGNDERQSK